jgi:hypothetical protein
MYKHTQAKGATQAQIIQAINLIDDRKVLLSKLEKPVAMEIIHANSFATKLKLMAEKNMYTMFAVHFTAHDCTQSLYVNALSRENALRIADMYCLWHDTTVSSEYHIQVLQYEQARQIARTGWYLQEDRSGGGLSYTIQRKAVA